MPFSISNLFTTKAAKGDGLFQPQREAIADLLNYCMYADNHIALAESKAIENVAGLFTWDPQISFESFEAGSIGAARQAKDDPAHREAFLNSVRERLNTPHSRSLALKVCKQLFVADGIQTDKESALLAHISDLLV